MLPEGVIQADFDEAIGELREALGPDAVIVQDDARYTSYTDAYTPRQLADNAPSAAVAPRDLEQIQRVLGRLGSKHQASRGTSSLSRPRMSGRHFRLQRARVTRSDIDNSSWSR